MNAIHKKAAPDPLYVIFEEHLYNFQDSDSDRKTFILNIVNEYIKYLRMNNITIPRAFELSIVEELANQVNDMLVKKIYGNLTLTAFKKTISPQKKRRAREQYKKIVSR